MSHQHFLKKHVSAFYGHIEYDKCISVMKKTIEYWWNTSIVWRVDPSQFWHQQGELKCKHIKWGSFIVLLPRSENLPLNQKVTSLVLSALWNNIIHHLSVREDTALWPGCWRADTNGKQHLTVNSWCLSTLLCVEAIWGMLHRHKVSVYLFLCWSISNPLNELSRLHNRPLAQICYSSQALSQERENISWIQSHSIKLWTYCKFLQFYLL